MATKKGEKKKKGKVVKLFTFNMNTNLKKHSN
jgi:hypothetical protein